MHSGVTSGVIAVAYTGKPADSVVTTQPAMMRAQGVSFIATAWPASAKEVIGRSISVGRSICATELCRAGASALDAAGCSTNASLTQQSIMIMAARMSSGRSSDVRKVVEVWGGNHGMSADEIHEIHAHGQMSKRLRLWLGSGSWL